MGSRRGMRRAASQRSSQEYSELQRDPSPPISEISHSHGSGDTIKEQLAERDQHVARLQDALRREREKASRLQSRCVQQGAELRRREQQNSRLRERLALLPDRHRDRTPSMEMLNPLPRVQKKRDQSARPAKGNAGREEAALRLTLVRREAELGEAMKLRHSLTTLLHALRADMERTLQDTVEEQDQEEDHDNQRLVQSEEALGDHVTGGVVQGWRKVQRSLGQRDLMEDQDKLMAQLEKELEESQQLVKLQQQLLQDSAVSPVPAALADCYFLEEWEGLHTRWAELEQQRRSFQRERQAFTDAAIRLGHERCEFEQQRASLIRHQYLCESPPFVKTSRHRRRESTALSLLDADPMSLSDSCPATPSSAEFGVTPWPGLRSRSPRGGSGVRVHTPSTPELYSALQLTYTCRSREGEAQSESWDRGIDRQLHTPHPPHMNWSF